MPDASETLVRWFLRFNGYLGVENFVVHEARDGAVAQGTESDILAVRFPYSREEVGAPLQNYAPLLPKDEAILHDIDFVIAEVKSGNRARLNDVWAAPGDAHKLRRVAYLIRWLGPFQDEATIAGLAKELQAKHQAVRKGFRFRMIFFSKKHRKPVADLGIQQITFPEIADFLVNVRAACWPRYGLGARSDHSQWDPLILRVWKLADPERAVPPAQKVSDVLALFEPPA